MKNLFYYLIQYFAKNIIYWFPLLFIDLFKVFFLYIHWKLCERSTWKEETLSNFHASEISEGIFWRIFFLLHSWFIKFFKFIIATLYDSQEKTVWCSNDQSSNLSLQKFWENKLISQLFSKFLTFHMKCNYSEEELCYNIEIF